MSRINNYEQLIIERRKLEADLTHYKSIINGEVNELRQNLEPLTNLVTFFMPSKHPGSNNKLLEAGTNLGIELFVRQKLLAKAGWFTKLVLPFVLKKISSKAIEQVQAIRK